MPPYKSLGDVCANCGKDAGKHSYFQKDGGGGKCPVGDPASPLYHYSKAYTFKSVVSESGPVMKSSVNMLCENCGYRFGSHVGFQCTDLNGDDITGSTYKAFNPPQYKPYDWHPPKDLKDLVDEVLDQEATNQLLIPTPAKAKPAKKEKKTKPWEGQKFNTPKVPKGEIKYYKPVPNKDHKPVIGDQIVTLDLGKVEETTIASMMAAVDPWKEPKTAIGSNLSSPIVKGEQVVTFSYSEMLNAVEALKAANAKSYPAEKQFYYHQAYGRSLRDVIREEPPIEALAEVYLKTNASTKTLVQLLVGFAQSAENPAVRKLAEELTTLKLKIKGLDQNFFQALQQSKKWRGECEAKDKEIEQLKAQMADMVPKARPMVPRSFSENGRKFKDIA